jgi:hypothetical protein
MFTVVPIQEIHEQPMAPGSIVRKATMNRKEPTIRDDATEPRVAEVPFQKQGKGQRRLNYRMRMLVENFISNGGNAAKAARDVGYGDPKTAGPHKMKHPAMQALLKERLESMGVNRDEVLGSLVMIMRTNIGSSDPAMVSNGLLAAIELCKILGMDPTRRPSARQKMARAGFRNVRRSWGKTPSKTRWP